MLPATALDRFRRILAIVVIATTTAACTGSNLGTEYIEISEQESKLLFDGPGLKNGFRRFLTGEDSVFVSRTIGIYGPPRGKLPFAQIMLVETPPGRHIARIDRPRNSIKLWNFFEDKTITLGVTGDATNAISRAKYAAFRADELYCVIWTQGFDARYDQSAGSHLLTGFYCRDGRAPMLTGEAERIVTLVGHREYGRL